MNLLAGKCYDPAAAVNKATTALLALTALDTTNLRLAFVVPPSGIVRVRLAGVLHGATTLPQIMLGVLEGATVKGRKAPAVGGSNLAATSLYAVESDFLVTGLTPAASLNWDAAYGVETIVAATGLKYGGANNATANDNFGGFVFEIWDPCPSYTPTAGTPPTTTVHTKVDAVNAKTTNLPSDPADQSLIIAATDAVMTRIGTNGAGLTALGDARLANLDALMSSRMATFTYAAPLDATGTRAALGLAAPNLDAQFTALPAANAAAYLKFDISLITGEAARSPLNTLRFLRNRWEVAGTTLTVYKEDSATVAWTAAVTLDANGLVTGIA